MWVTGAVRITASGGHGNFAYKWNEQAAQADLQNAAAGNYHLLATDESGCSRAFDYVISQPAPLTLQLQSPAICDGHSTGKITAAAGGGAPPYLFSLNQKTQESNIFGHLSPGAYSVTAQDANECAITVNAVIGKLNVKPKVNFLAATRKNAFDTLVIKEISLPEPDSVHWVFDPRTEFLGYEGRTPLIKCKLPGTYWVEMNGKWNGCHYSVKKNIAIAPYDPLAGPGKKLPVNVIGEATLSPNPTSGNFHLSVKLNRKQRLTIYIYSMSGHKMAQRQYEPGLSLEEDFSIDVGTPAGTYILRVMAENDSRDVKFVLIR